MSYASLDSIIPTSCSTTSMRLDPGYCIFAQKTDHFLSSVFCDRFLCPLWQSSLNFKLPHTESWDFHQRIHTERISKYVQSITKLPASPLKGEDKSIAVRRETSFQSQKSCGTYRASETRDILCFFC